MTDPEPSALARLEREHIVWLCTVRPDGSPHLAPVWFVYRQGTWWICTNDGAAKVRNMVRDPRVSLALDNPGDAPIVAEGRALLHHAEFPNATAEAFATKYGWDIGTPFEGVHPRVLIEVPVTRWLFGGRTL